MLPFPCPKSRVHRRLHPHLECIPVFRGWISLEGCPRVCPGWDKSPPAKTPSRAAGAAGASTEAAVPVQGCPQHSCPPRAPAWNWVNRPQNTSPLRSLGEAPLGKAALGCASIGPALASIGPALHRHQSSSVNIGPALQQHRSSAVAAPMSTPMSHDLKTHPGDARPGLSSLPSLVARAFKQYTLLSTIMICCL